jgi:hypothetical protein
MNVKSVATRQCLDRKRDTGADSMTNAEAMDSAPIQGKSEFFLFRPVT